jgi:hypothetical protein
MARQAKTTTFEIVGENFGKITAGWGGRCVDIAFAREDETLIVDMDSIEAWSDGDEVSLPELQRLLELVERECDARGIEAEFE